MGNVHSAATSCRRPDAAKELLRAAECGDVQALGSVVEDDVRLAFHYSVFGGNSAWHKAAKGGHAAVLEALEALVVRHCEQDSKDVNEVLRPSIPRAGSSNAADVVARLINKANVKGLTPLMLACAGGHTDVVAWLVKHGADIWKHERVRRHTALHCAAEAGATDAIRLLLARAGTEQHPGNNRTLLEQGNHAGLTALHYAVYCEQHEVVAQLVAQDADITAQAEFPDLDWGCINAGDTPMHIAAHKGNIDAIQIMLKAYNEKSGALLPNLDSARRLRDPRAMRNDYGRLPYHLAMRKGLTWLGEMLDPSVPVRFLLTDEQLDANTNWGPPRLATIAAAVLHRSLVADLKGIQAAAAAAAQAQQPAGGSVTTAAAAAAAITPTRHAALHVTPPPGVFGSGSSPSGGDASSSSVVGGGGGSSRRRWGRHRRANSDAARWAAARLSDFTTPSRPASAGRRLSTGGLVGRSIRAARAASPNIIIGAGAGSSSSGGPSAAAVVQAPSSSGGGDRINNLQEALGQLSPRALVAALVGGSGSGGGSGSSDEAAAAGNNNTSSSSAVSPAPASAAVASAAAAAGLLLLSGASPDPAAAASPGSSSSSTWRRLVTRQVRLGGGGGGAREAGSSSKQQLPQLQCTSPEPEDGCSPLPQSPQHQQQAAAASAADQGGQKGGCRLLRSASDSLCLEMVSSSGQQDNKQQDHDQLGKVSVGIVLPAAAVADNSGKVSPFPELKPDMPDAVLEGLLEQYMAELRGHSTTPAASSSPCTHNTNQQQQQVGGSVCGSDDEGQTCGVCLDAAPSAMINPCEHTMCAECALDMCERCPLGTAMCPFCRCIIKSFVPVVAAAAAGTIDTTSTNTTSSSNHSKAAPEMHARRQAVALPVC